MIARSAFRKIVALATTMTFAWFFVVDSATKPASVIGPFGSVGQCQSARDAVVRQGYRVLINCWEPR
jgi:hypothetical protein